jgi:hypothetical protein
MLHICLIPSDLVKCFTGTRKLENTQRRICYYDLFSQIVRLEKAMSKRIFFSFSAASVTVHKGQVSFIVAGDINSQ